MYWIVDVENYSPSISVNIYERSLVILLVECPPPPPTGSGSDPNPAVASCLQGAEAQESSSALCRLWWWHLGCFHGVATVNGTALRVITWVLVELSDLGSFGSVWRPGIAGSHAALCFQGSPPSFSRAVLAHSPRNGADELQPDTLPRIYHFLSSWWKACWLG